MSVNLTYKPIPDVGVNGLNTQDNPVSLDTTWLTGADNIVLKEAGQVSFRKGLKQNVLAITGGAKIGAIGEYKGGTVSKVFASIGTKIYDVDFANPDTPWTTSSEVTGSSSDWQFIEFNSDMYALQAEHTPLRYIKNQLTDTWSTEFTAPTGITLNPSCGMGFYGRMWVGGVSAARDVVYYSDTLIGTNFNQGSIEVADKNQETCETGGDFWNSIDKKCYSVPTYAGVIDLKGVWGADEIVAIAPFYGKLVIFGKHNIVIYTNPEDPATMYSDEVIAGVGCVSRDSVVSVGDDLFFMSSTGLRSLARTTQQENLPMMDLSVNIKDTLIRNIQQNPNIKAVYVENEGVCLASFVDLNITYVFDLKHRTPNDAPRVTTWTFDSSREPASLAYTESRGFLVGQQKGSIATYEGYFDREYIGDVALTTIEKGKSYIITTVTATDWSSVGGPSVAVAFPDGTIATNRFTSAWDGDEVATSLTGLGIVKEDKPGFPYTGTFKTPWINLGDSVMASILKKLKAVINGGSGSHVGVKWYKDFSPVPAKVLNFTLNPTSAGTPALFGASTSLYSCNIAYDYDTEDTETPPDQPANCTAYPTKYTPYYGLKEYNVPLSGSAKHLQIEMSAETNGYVASLQNLTLLTKQGKIR